jgi:hypothetical protein
MVVSPAGFSEKKGLQTGAIEHEFPSRPLLALNWHRLPHGVPNSDQLRLQNQGRSSCL